MPVRVLIAVLAVLLVCLLAAAVDRAVKVIKRERRRREAGRRLAAAADPVAGRVLGPPGPFNRVAPLPLLQADALGRRSENRSS